MKNKESDTMKNKVKKTAIIYTKPNFIFPAIYAGLMLLGYRVLWRNGGLWQEGCGEPCDLIVLHGMGHTAPMIKEYYEQRARTEAVYAERVKGKFVSEDEAKSWPVNFPVLVVDLGYFARDKGYWQMGLGGLNNPPAGDFESDRAQAMGLIAAPRTGKKSGHVLICAQKPNDAQHPFKTQAEVDAQIEKMKEHAMRVFPKNEIVIRQHPKAVQDLPPLAEALTDAAAMVTYNSTAAFEAMTMGIPVIAHQSACYAEAAKAETPEAMQAVLNRFAYGQWTEEEFASGEPFQYYLDDVPRKEKPAPALEPDPPADPEQPQNPDPPVADTPPTTNPESPVDTKKEKRSHGTKH
jgi:hypothetical protein